MIIRPGCFPDKSVMIRIGSRWLALSDGDGSTVKTREREPYALWVRNGNFVLATQEDGVAYARRMHLNARRLYVDFETVRTDGQTYLRAWVKPWRPFVDWCSRQPQPSISAQAAQANSCRSRMTKSRMNKSSNS